MRLCDVIAAGDDVLDLAAAGSSLPDHAVAVVGDRIAEVGSWADMLAMLRSIAH